MLAQSVAFEAAPLFVMVIFGSPSWRFVASCTWNDVSAWAIGIAKFTTWLFSAALIHWRAFGGSATSAADWARAAARLGCTTPKFMMMTVCPGASMNVYPQNGLSS